MDFKLQSIPNRDDDIENKENNQREYQRLQDREYYRDRKY